MLGSFVPGVRSFAALQQSKAPSLSASKHELLQGRMARRFEAALAGEVVCCPPALPLSMARTLLQDGANMPLQQLRLDRRNQRLARGGVQVVLTPLILLR